MYPTLFHLIRDVFGLEIELLKFINSFGLFVVLGFFAAAITLAMELGRKTREKSLPEIETTIEKGRGLNIFGMLINGTLGFFLGFKAIDVIQRSPDLSDTIDYLMSNQGSMAGGLVVALLFMAFFVWGWWKEKQEYPELTTLSHTVTAKEHASNLAMRAAIWGFLGAKLFALIEDPRDLINFFRDFDTSKLTNGLAIYGGLICGGLGVILYFRKHKMNVLSGADAAAPGVMLAYGIGRLGCHFSGDGDWGIVNARPQPAWLPDWLWSYSYPNNVNGVIGPSEKGGYIAKHITQDMDVDIYEGYGTYLDPGVWPTAVYETIMATILFAILWSLRKRLKVPGMIFALYIVFTGIERLFIEQVRVNDDLEFLGFQATQAEYISVGMIVCGLVGLFLLRARRNHGLKPLDEI